MTALSELNKKSVFNMTDLERCVWNIESESAAAELSRLQAIEAAVSAKVVEWRKKANEIECGSFDYYSRDQSDTLDDCADELAALLEDK